MRRLARRPFFLVFAALVALHPPAGAAGAGTADGGDGAARGGVPARGEYIDMTLSGADLSQALQSIARAAGASLVLQEGVRATVSVRLEHVHFEKALEMVALSGGYGLNRVAERTYMVGDSKTITAAAGAGGHRTFRLRYQNAEELVHKIATLFSRRRDVGIATAFGEDCLLVVGSTKALDEIGALIAELDVAPPNVKSVFTLVRLAPGPGGKDLETAIAAFTVTGASGWKSRVSNTHKYPLGKGADGVARCGEVYTELVILAVAARDRRVSLTVDGKFSVVESAGEEDRNATRFTEGVASRLVVTEGERRDIAVYREASGETLALRMVTEVEPVR